MKELVEYDFTDGYISHISAQQHNTDIRFMNWREEPVKLLFEDSRMMRSLCSVGCGIECVMQSDEDDRLRLYRNPRMRFAPPLYLFTFISSSEGVPVFELIAHRLFVTKLPYQAPSPIR